MTEDFNDTYDKRRQPPLSRGTPGGLELGYQVHQVEINHYLAIVPLLKLNESIPDAF